MANIDTIQLTGDNFVDIGKENVIGLIVANTYTEDIGFDLIIGKPSLNGTNTTTDVVFVLKGIPIPVG